ncbi:hypothetical protein BCR34DRAFT_577872 [Clohesyomyces aquaticus]|uniref:Rhodopsin domain-containing protein n=1 Tax=Clohesyomyces aquaticus TaxID=1231657 RepID=A0A1Y1YHJ5_9PLEO|nr:hypothetical protein BCR34DRAFT_577872 [Clohesyomyces aquaticus]
MDTNISPPAAAVNPLDHSGWIVISNALGLVFTLLSLGMRLYIRKRISPPSKRDDFVVWVATGFGTLQAILVFWRVHEGFGKTQARILADDIEKIQKIGYATDPLFITTIYLTKCSIVCLLLRITPDEVQRKKLKLVLAACVVFAVISVILDLTVCEISRPWVQTSEKCENLFVRRQIMAAFDVASELVLFIIPVTFLVKLNMKLGKKAKVVSAFATRLLIIPLALLRLYQLRAEIDSADPTLIGALASVWTQTQMHYALIATTLPCGTPFLMTVVTNFGHVELQNMMDGQSRSSTKPTLKSDPAAPKTSKNASSTLMSEEERDEEIKMVWRKPTLLAARHKARTSNETAESQQAMTRNREEEQDEEQPQSAL